MELLFFFIALILTASSYIYSRHAKSWLAVDANVKSINTEEIYDEDGDFEKNHYSISYEYCFRGKFYTGNRICFGSKQIYDNGLLNQLSSIRKNQVVTVYVNPWFPGESVLFNEYHGAAIFCWLIFVGFVIVFIIFS